MNTGETFVNVNPGSPTHLWVVIAKSGQQVAIVNFTTRRANSDDTCVVSEGEHPFVSHETVVHYRQGQMVDDFQLESAKKHGYILTREAISPELLRRIQEGALASPYAAQKIQAAVRTALGK